jgi:hypothetical protein
VDMECVLGIQRGGSEKDGFANCQPSDGTQ